MGLLAQLKADATTKLAAVHTDVVTYIHALEARVAANRYWIVGGSALGFVLGYLARGIAGG